MNIESSLRKQIKEEIYNSIQTSVLYAEKFGVNIYLIGGVVRDLLLNKPIKDIDIAVEYDAVDFCNNLTKDINCNIVSIQENLKTVKVIFNNNTEIDFASTREEKYINSGVLPDAYNFGCTLNKDIRRRDFTINTLAIKLTGKNKYELIDTFNGQNDLEHKLIRILHDKSFSDDPSRIIRALKFKERLQFKYEENTYTLMQKYLKNPYENIPLERIKQELIQYFSLNADNLYPQFIETNAYKLICENPIKCININNLNKIKKYNLVDYKNLYLMYFCILFHNTEMLPCKLNLKSFEKKAIQETKDLKNLKVNNDDLEIYKKFHNKSNYAIMAYYIISGDNNVIKYLEEFQNIKLNLKGKDLIDFGLNPSESFGIIFELILKEKLKGKLKTKQDEINYLKTIIKKI